MLALFALIAVLVAAGTPLGVTLGLSGLYLLHFAGPGNLTSVATPAIWNLFTDFTLTAVPLFIAMGDILLEGGVSNRIYASVAPLFRRIPGGLLQTNIVVATLFGAVCGSSTATAAAVGSVAYPELKRRGYEPRAVAGTLAGGGTLGLLIPPSISLLIYGAMLDVSIGKLFLAGILPGLMYALAFMGFVAFKTWKTPSILGQAEEHLSLWESISRLAGIWPLAGLMFAVLGTIYAGLATPTEAAAIGVAAAAVLGFAYRELTLRSLGVALLRSAVSFGALSLVIAGAVILAQAVSILAIPRSLIDMIDAFELSPYALLLAVIVLYLLLGCFFDGLSLMIMTLPFVFPVMTAAGFDPVWLGVVVTIMVEVGMITPPVGMNLFVIAAMTKGDVPVLDLAKATLPYWLILLLGVGALVLFPSIALWLPAFI